MCQTRAYIERLDDVVLFFSDQEITWSGVVYVYLLGNRSTWSQLSPIGIAPE